MYTTALARHESLKRWTMNNPNDGLRDGLLEMDRTGHSSGRKCREREIRAEWVQMASMLASFNFFSCSRT